MGFVFKIYLSRQLGAVNIGIYQVAISIFFVLATCTSSGIPLVIGKWTARYKTNFDKDTALLMEGKTVSAGILVGLSFSILLCIAFLSSGKYIQQAFASPESFVCLVLLLPALLATSISNSIRGALWGRGMYKVSSVLEIIEQTVRIALCVVLFWIGTNRLVVTALTFSLSCGIAAIICFVYYYFKNGRLKNPKGHIVPLLKDSAPITLSKISSSIINMLVSLSIPFLFALQGATKEEGLFLLGISIGMAFPLLFTPLTFVGSLAYTMLPDISALYSKRSPDTRKRIESGITISIVIACVFMPAFLALGQDAGQFLFDHIEAGRFIVYSAWILLPLAIESIVSSMMNALELEFFGLLSFLAGSALMFGICFAFWGHFSLRIFSIAFGCSLTLSSLIDILLIKKRIGLQVSKCVPILIECGILILPTFLVTTNLYQLFKNLFSLLHIPYQGFWVVSNFGLCSLISIGFYLLSLYLLDFANVFGLLQKTKTKNIQKQTNKTCAKSLVKSTKIVVK
ncbi:MAG: oligosaccharide flippase family protein [Firmicutes bacterium]|nr:oligosaccharide flippase family protein [Bacillota bacterium]